MRLVLLQRAAQDARGELDFAGELDRADPDLGALVDLKGDIDLVLAGLGGGHFDCGRSQPLFSQQLLDGLADALQLVGTVVAVSQEVFVLLLELVGDVVFLDLAPRLVGDRLDQRGLLDGDGDDPAAGPGRLADLDVREEPRRPENAEVLLEDFLAVIIALFRGQVVTDGVLGDPVVADDIDAVDQLLGGGDKRYEGQQGDQKELSHDPILIA